MAIFDNFPEFEKDEFCLDGDDLDWIGGVDIYGNMVQVISYNENLDHLSVMVNNHVHDVSIDELDQHIAYWIRKPE